MPEPTAATPDSEAVARAAQIKAEGDKLFKSKDYAAAYFKYADAIELDKSNAVLYANRGACSFAMEKYLGAASDCEEATKLDPKYVKAWMRLGAACSNIGVYDSSRDAYRQALSLLSARKLTRTEASFKRQCEEELKKVEASAKIEKPMTTAIRRRSQAGELPWIKAYNMREKIRDRGPSGAHSSAWLLLDGYLAMRTALDVIKEVRKEDSPDDPERYGIRGYDGGLECMTTAIMIDPRVWFFDHPDCDRNYDLQIEMEISSSKAFCELGAQAVIAEALKMKEADGWNAVRPALATTIRSWILRAFKSNDVGGESSVGLECYNEAIEVLEWGRQVWRNVPDSKRGEIFHETFLRKAKCLRMQCYIDAHARNRARFPLDTAFQDAKDMLRMLHAAGPAPEDIKPSQNLAFYVYPRALALHIIGVYYRDVGNEYCAQEDCETAKEYYAQAADYCMQAAVVLPQDDEQHVASLFIAVDMMFCAVDYPVKDVLDVMEKMRTAIPAMYTFWGRSATYEQRDENIGRMLVMEEGLRARVKEGKLTMESIAVRPAITSARPASWFRDFVTRAAAM